MESIFAALRSPGPELIHLGPLTIRWYGLLIALAVLIGLNLSSYLAYKRGLKGNLISDLLPLLVLSSVIGARVYYVGFEWKNYFGINFWSSLNIFGIAIPVPSFLEIWGGGIAIHGALIAGTISVIVFSKLRNQPFWDLLDVLIPSVALGQAIGRWGNFFNNEAFGVPTNLPWKLFIPKFLRPDAFLQEKFFHPTFIYESLWNVLVFIFLITLFNLGIDKKINLPSGSLSFIYLISYSLGRFWIEGLRIDPLCINASPPFCEGGIRAAQLISVLLTLTGMFGLWNIYKKRRVLPTQNKIQTKF